MDAALAPLLSTLEERYPELVACHDDIVAAYTLLRDAVDGGHKILLAGNGGSAADADHIAGELLKGFCHPRPLGPADIPAGDPALAKLQGAIPAIPLTGFAALRTAVANDTDPDLEFAQLVWGLGAPGDILWVHSTSGGARNIALAMQAAHGRGMHNLLLTGQSPKPPCADPADVTIRVPDTETFRIQERHLPIYHVLCLALESHAFGT